MSAYEQLLDDSREVLGDLADELTPYFNPPLQVRMGSYKRDNYFGRTGRIFREQFPFSGQAVISSSLNAALAPAARQIYAWLLAATPIDSGFLRRNYQYLVNGVVMDRLIVPKDGYPEGTRISIINRATYAAVQENPGWSRPFHKTLTKARKLDVDTSFHYISPDTIGGNVVNKGKMYKLSVPAITIAELGTFGSEAGKVNVKRKRKNRRKRDKTRS